MNNLRVIAALTILSGAPLFAQMEANNLMVNVNVPTRQGANGNESSASVKLFLDGHELTVWSVEALSETPLHIVFVLDNGGHQQKLMSLAQDYVTKLAAAIRSS